MSTRTLDAIIANTALIEARLSRAAALAKAAHAAAAQCKQNLAIGTILLAQDDIAEADALLKTILVLHRSRPDTAEEGGAQ